MTTVKCHGCKLEVRMVHSNTLIDRDGQRHELCDDCCVAVATVVIEKLGLDAVRNVLDQARIYSRSNDR